MSEKSIADVNIDSLEIKDVININLLQTFQNNFAESMDIASVIVDMRGIPVTKPSYYTSFCIDYVHSTKIGDKRCAECHRKAGEEAARLGKTYIYTCHAGLIDFAAPILIEGKQIGTILGGQILKKKIDEPTCRKTAREIGVDEDKFYEAAKKIKITKEKNIKAAAEVLFIVANALSKIGYEELKLKIVHKNLQQEVIEKESMLRESSEYNKLKTQFFSTISHELKTPVNIIYSSLQLLESIYKSNSEVPSADTFLKYSNIMKLNSYRLIRIINNLIDLNKYEFGFNSINLKNDDIIKVVEDVSLSVVEYARLKSIELIFDTEIEEKVMAFDSEKIERIILNLLSNAVKFTEPGGNINICIYDKNEYLLISVKDTGIGIPENMLDKIFHTFTQVDSSFTRNVEGSGIGLSIVRLLVEMHEGKVWAKSELGKGSEFIIKLPIKLISDEINTNNQREIQFNSNIERIKMEFSDIYL